MSVIVRCCGGLGNQMFQYAFGRALALDIGTDLKMDISRFARGGRPLAVDAFHLSEDASFCGRSPFLPRLKMKLAQKMNRRNIKTFDRCFSDLLLEPFPAYFIPVCNFKIRPEKDVFVGGYWQSERYFVHHADRIKRDFTLKDESSSFLEWKEILLKDTDFSVSVHVRRGDYVSDSSAHRVHGVMPVEYYQKAAKTLLANNRTLVFYVFTDDSRWVQDNLDLHGDVVHVSGHDLRDCEELVLMSLCRHHVVANSSFSWWGAWLARGDSGTTIAPVRWFRHMSSDHIVPEKWLRI